MVILIKTDQHGYINVHFMSVHGALFLWVFDMPSSSTINKVIISLTTKSTIPEPALISGLPSLGKREKKLIND